MPIRVLDPQVASQIAAGEVVERPASVVKELIENSIDAGATEIKIEVREGGRRLIRVIDNGSGIPASEVELAFARHATSKLSSAADLERIITLGFRGEALPSIAAVSRGEMLTRTPDQAEGFFIRLEGGKVVTKEKRGAPVGTVVSVADLFYSTPARRKFLRQDTTETGHILDLVSRYAMAYPHLRLTLLSDGRTLFRSPGSGNLYDILVAAYGLEIAKQMLPLESGSGPIRIMGYVGIPSLHRANTRHIRLLVNGRWVRDQLLTYAIREAYHTLLPTGRYPVAVVRVDLPPEEVDVNVHPAKSEVRFRNSQEVFTAVQRTVRHTLAATSPIPQVSHPLSTPQPSEERRRLLVSAGSEERPQLALEVPRAEGKAAAPGRTKIPPLRMLGQLGKTYIIAEGPGGMYLIDQHAAHERVLYERLLADHQGKKLTSQPFLEPITLELTSQETAAVEGHRETLAAWGFDLEPFGGQTYILRAVPTVLLDANPVSGLREVLDEASHDAGKWEAAFVISLACHSAIRAGKTLAEEEMRELVRQLEETESPRTCAHGRPTMIHMSAEQLEKEFGRR